MGEFRNAKDALDRCVSKGQLLPLAEIDMDLIRSILALADGDQLAGQKLSSGLEKDSVLWNNVFNSYYDALHKVSDAFVRMDRFNATTHLCLFAHICHKYPSLELDWGFFETVRTKRNGTQYYGQKATKTDWTQVEVQMKLYIRTLKEEIIKRIAMLSGK